MVTIFDKAGELLLYKIGGVLPVWIPILIGGFGFIIYLMITRRPKAREYKPINLKQELKKDLDVQYKYFYTPVKKKIYSGLIKLGSVTGYMPFVWNNRYYYKLLTRRIKNEDRIIEVRTSESDASKTTAKIKVVDNPIPLLCFKIYQGSLLGRIKAIFGFGMKYFLIDEKAVAMDEDSIKIDSGLERQYFFGQFIFSRAGKSIMDNTSFRIDRENQLQEIANQIPRTVFFDTELAKRAIMAREAFALEKEKFKAQKESMED